MPTDFFEASYNHKIYINLTTKLLILYWCGSSKPRTSTYTYTYTYILDKSFYVQRERESTCVLVIDMTVLLSCPLGFQVNRCEPRLITPAKPTPYETKLLSDIDNQQGLRFHVPFIMSYKNNPSISSKQNDPVEMIIDALSRALEFYYPLAGRLREVQNKKLVVDCTGEGFLFVEANAKITLDELGDAILPPCPFLDEFLFNVPGSDGILGSPLLLIQVK